MYDKLKLWLNSEDIEGGLSFVASLLSNATEQIDRQTGETKVFGALEGLKVSIFGSGVSIIGSLSKYFYPNSIYPLNRATSKEALEKLSDTLHFNIGIAKVTGLEFGTVLLLTQPIAEYLKLMGQMPYPLHRCQFEPKTLYYRTGNKQQPLVYAYYDKVAEAKADGLKVPVGLEGQNLLKYEIRLNGRLPKQLNVPEVKASTLTEKGFYRRMVQRWGNDYFKVTKRMQNKTNGIEKIETVSDACNVFVARLIATADNDVIYNFIDELKGNKTFKYRTDYCRLKHKLEQLASKASVEQTDELVKELDNAIKNAVAYY